MFNKVELLKEEIDCVNMLGMTLEKYHKYIKSIKINNQQFSDNDYNDENFEDLGLPKEDLKRN